VKRARYEQRVIPEQELRALLAQHIALMGAVDGKDDGKDEESMAVYGAAPTTYATAAPALPGPPGFPGGPPGMRAHRIPSPTDHANAFTQACLPRRSLFLLQDWEARHLASSFPLLEWALLQASFIYITSMLAVADHELYLIGMPLPPFAPPGVPGGFPPPPPGFGGPHPGFGGQPPPMGYPGGPPPPQFGGPQGGPPPGFGGPQGGFGGPPPTFVHGGPPPPMEMDIMDEDMMDFRYRLF